MTKKKHQPYVKTIKHATAKRTNIPTAELQPIVEDEIKRPIQVAYKQRNPDLDPQLVWRGKDVQHWSDLVVDAPPLYIQEKVHPKVLMDDLIQQTKERQEDAPQMDLFADFNGVPDGDAKTEFYQHDAHWTNRMILGDSLQVMASLAEREGLRGKVQCIYLDPPYGIKFNSNFQWSTNTRNVKDGKTDHITREPEQVKAFRDTWKDGIHSYLTYLRDRLTVARDLLTESGSIFVQIGDENVHRVRCLMDEVFGEENFVSQISYKTTSGFTSGYLSSTLDYLLWYGKSINKLKYRQLYLEKESPLRDPKTKYDQVEYDLGKRRSVSKSERMKSDQIDGKIFRYGAIDSQGAPPEPTPFSFQGKIYDPPNGRHWTGNYPIGMERLDKANRIVNSGRRISYVRYFKDFSIKTISNVWTTIGGTVQSRSDPKIYVVQTGTSLIQRCILMTTAPGDLVLDPTCGSGTTAYVAEQWGRRWITIDTSRVALALARTRLMGARYPYYLLADSQEGQLKEAEVTRTVPSQTATYGNINLGFVYQRVPHITLKSIANNAEIDVIYDDFQQQLEPLRATLNEVTNNQWEAWEIPRELPADVSAKAKKIHAEWWKLRIARQKEIDASIAAKADVEYLYDQPYEDKGKVRVAGPFTVESISPHRMLGVDEDGDTFNQLAREDEATYHAAHDFTQLILNNLRKSGVQQDKKADRIQFDELMVWPGEYLHAEGRYTEADGRQRRAGIHIGPEFGSVGRQDLVAAAREAADAGFDLVIGCAFNYDAHSTEFSKLGRMPVLKARMNADLHMAEDLAATGAGNLFVIFGEPDVDLLKTAEGQYQIKVKGVDIFDPKTGKVRSDETDGIACWFVDTNYNGESFFVRHAYFLGANDPYKSLKRSLKAEVDREAWESLYGDTSRPFAAPETGRIAVKIINHLGDEVMKVMRVTN